MSTTKTKTKTEPVASAPTAGKPKPVRDPGKPLNKTQLVLAISEKTGLTASEVKSALAALVSVVKDELSSKGYGQVTVPDLVQVRAVGKPAVEAGQGINPFTKEPMQVKAKPATRVVRFRVQSALKNAVADPS